MESEEIVETNSFCSIFWNGKFIGESSTKFNTINPIWSEEKSNLNLQRFILKIPISDSDEEILHSCVLQVNITNRVLRPSIPVKIGSNTDPKIGSEKSSEKNTKFENILAINSLDFDDEKVEDNIPKNVPVNVHDNVFPSSENILLNHTKSEILSSDIDDDDRVEKEVVLGKVIITGTDLLLFLSQSKIQTKWFPIILSKNSNTTESQLQLEKNARKNWKKTKKNNTRNKKSLQNFLMQRNTIKIRKKVPEYTKSMKLLKDKKSFIIIKKELREQNLKYLKSKKYYRLPLNENNRNVICAESYRDEDEIGGELKIRFGFKEDYAGYTGDNVYEGEFR